MLMDCSLKSNELLMLIFRIPLYYNEFRCRCLIIFEQIFMTKTPVSNYFNHFQWNHSTIYFNSVQMRVILEKLNNPTVVLAKIHMRLWKVHVSCLANWQFPGRQLHPAVLVCLQKSVKVLPSRLFRLPYNCCELDNSLLDPLKFGHKTVNSIHFFITFRINLVTVINWRHGPVA